MAFCEGRLASGTPAWLVGCHTLSLAGAFMYLLMSVWFSMHASITAKSYETRLLTQLVRLPVPSWSQLEGARTYGSTFEKTTTKQMLRVPFVMGTQQRAACSCLCWRGLKPWWDLPPFIFWGHACSRRETVFSHSCQVRACPLSAGGNSQLGVIERWCDVADLAT
ncbi:unnamed protein product [Effrenium voratum]|nr:unnamed protein product [Effrenium voratum]